MEKSHSNDVRLPLATTFSVLQPTAVGFNSFLITTMSPPNVQLRALGPVELASFSPKTFGRSKDKTWAIVKGVVSELDDDLRVKQALPLPPVADGSTLCDVDNGAALVLIDGQLSLLLEDGAKSLEIANVDMAKFVGGAILASAPEGNAHKLVLVSRDGEVQSQHVVQDASDARAWIHPHPSGTAVVELAMGQDGCITCTVSIDSVAGTLTVAPLNIPAEYTVSGFNPDGTKLFLGAHPNDSHVIAVMDWATNEITKTLRSDGLLAAINDEGDELDAAFDVHGGWLTPDLIICSTTQYGLRVVVADGGLHNPQLGELPDFQPPPDAEDAEILWLYVIGNRRFVARTWVDGEMATRLYEVEP